ncbi:MAG TPA: 2'-5' RNA ligase family protein [Stellaceae bacterium]|nr:2'-5' RNA ligase family protein [Stellaceae bacterium]
MLVIISQLDLAVSDRRWLEEIRRRHDPQHAMVAAHFTLVFPFGGLRPDEVLEHASAVASTTSPINFRLAAAKAVQDALTPRNLVFLVPDEGASEIRALHGRLYSDVLAAKLRADIPYEPHVTVGAFSAHAEAERAASDIGAISVDGWLSTLDLAEFDGRKIAFLHRLRLSDTGRQRRAARRRKN